MSIKEKNVQLNLDELYLRKTQIESYPYEVHLALTEICNLKCAFCNFCGLPMTSGKKENYISLNLLEKIDSVLKHATYLNISGRGEPLLYKHFDKLIEICDRNNTLNNIHLITNGTQLKEEKIKVLSKVPKIDISFDGANKRSFEILRYGANWESVLEGIKALRSANKDITIGFAVTVNRLNLDEIYDIVELAQKLGVNSVALNAVGGQANPIVDILRLRASDMEIYREQIKMIREKIPQEVVSVWDGVVPSTIEDHTIRDKEKIYEQLEGFKKSTGKIDYDQLQLLSNDEKKIKHNFKTGLLNLIRKDKSIKLPYCTMPWKTLFVNYNGDIYPCCAGYGKIDNLTDKTFEEVWNGKEYQKLRKAMFNYDMLPEHCKKCKSSCRYSYLDAYIKKLRDDNTSIDELEMPDNFILPQYMQNLIEDIKSNN